MIFYNKTKNIIFLFVLGLTIVSCNLFTEPEPIVNKDFKPPNLPLSTNVNYSWVGDSLNGTLNLVFIPDTNQLYIKLIQIYVDSVLFISNEFHKYDSKYSSYKYSINTRLVVNGLHNITFKVTYYNTSTNGLFNLKDIEPYFYSKNIYFLHYPTPINGYWFHVSPTGTFHPKLTWDYPPALEPEVLYTVINRIDLNTNQISHIDTLFDHSHSYVDTSIFVTWSPAQSRILESNILYEIGIVNQVGIPSYATNFAWIADL